MLLTGTMVLALVLFYAVTEPFHVRRTELVEHGLLSPSAAHHLERGAVSFRCLDASQFSHVDFSLVAAQAKAGWLFPEVGVSPFYDMWASHNFAKVCAMGIRHPDFLWRGQLRRQTAACSPCSWLPNLSLASHPLACTPPSRLLSTLSRAPYPLACAPNLCLLLPLPCSSASIPVPLSLSPASPVLLNLSPAPHLLPCS